VKHLHDESLYTKAGSVDTMPRQKEEGPSRKLFSAGTNSMRKVGNLSVKLHKETVAFTLGVLLAAAIGSLHIPIYDMWCDAPHEAQSRRVTDQGILEGGGDRTHKGGR
jgi:hypothetical protein